MTITIDKQEVLEDIKREAEYAAAKGGDYDHQRIIDADDELLHRWVSDSCAAIVAELGDVITEAMTAGGVWTANTTHDNGNETHANVCAQSFVEQRVLAEWMLLCNQADRAQVHATKATEKLAELKKVAYHRIIP